MLVQFPFQKRKVASPQGTPSKESAGWFGISSDKEDDSIITVSDDGSDPNGASTSTGRTVPTSRRKRSREGRPSDAPPTKKPADRDERSHNLDRSFCNIYIIPSFPTQEQHARSVQNARSRFNKLNQSYSC